MKPPGLALTALQKKIHCNLSCTQSEGAFRSSMFEVTSVKSAVLTALVCHQNLA